MEESQPEPWNIHEFPTFGRMSFPLEIRVSLLVYWLTKGKLQDQIKACGKRLSIVCIYIYVYVCIKQTLYGFANYTYTYTYNITPNLEPVKIAREFFKRHDLCCDVT